MKHFTVKEAAERTGKSTSAIRRLILPIAHDPKHADRGLILPTPAEVQAFKKSGTNFGWTVAEELLDRLAPAAAAKPRATKPGDGATMAAIVDLLRQQMTRDQQQQLEEKDRQIASLHERIHETNVLIGTLQQKLAALPPPSDGSATDAAAATNDTAKRDAPIPFWQRLFRS